MTPIDEERGPVPEWLVERLAAGELSPARANEIRQRLAREPGGLARLERIAASNEEILAAHPPAIVAGEVLLRRLAGAEKTAETAEAAEAAAARTRTAPAAPPRRWGFALGAPTLALAALGLALWLRPTPPRPGRAAGAGDASESAADDTDRLKGLRPGLRVYRKVGDRVERLRDGAVTRAGDRLQLAYVAAGRRFGAVLSVDGAGQVTFHLPSAGRAAERLRSDGEVALPEAYELDAAPGFERFVLIAADAPFDAAHLIDVARGTAPAPTGTVTFSFTVRKESP